jgi:hypothetical protein
MWMKQLKKNVSLRGVKKPGVTLEVAPGQLTLYALVSAKSGLTSGNSHIDTAHLP